MIRCSRGGREFVKTCDGTVMVWGDVEELKGINGATWWCSLVSGHGVLILLMKGLRKVVSKCNL